MKEPSTTAVSTGTRIGVGAALGLALATVVLPQVASALNPTGWGTAFVTLFVALLGATAQQRAKRAPGKGPGPWFVGCAVATVAVVLAIGILYTTDLHLLRKPRSIDDQINMQLGQLIDHGRNHIVVNERLQLHPSDDPSWVVVTENAPNAANFDAWTANRRSTDPEPTSDELRVYDIDGDGWLSLKLDYRPVGKGIMARRWVTPAGAPAAFDYNGNGLPEIIAGYSRLDVWEETLPFVVDWTGDGYALKSMTPLATPPNPPNPPPLPTSGFGDPALVKKRHTWYQTPLSLPDAHRGPHSTPPLAGYQVGAFAFVDSPAPRLLTGYLARYPQSAKPKVLELRSNQISLSDFHLSPCHHGDPYCEAPLDERNVTVPPSKLLNNGLLLGWQQVSSLWTPKVTPVAERPTPDCPAPCD